MGVTFIFQPQNRFKRVLFASIAVLAIANPYYARCHIFNTRQFPPKKREVITPKDLGTLRGGKPFLCEVMDEIGEIVLSKASRLVISIDGYFTDKIIRVP